MSSKSPSIAAMSKESSEDKYMDSYPYSSAAQKFLTSRRTPYLVVGEFHDMNAFMLGS
jgi:hypothetical protein